MGLAIRLARLYVPTAGTIWMDGVDLQTNDPHVWQQQILDQPAQVKALGHVGAMQEARK